LIIFFKESYNNQNIQFLDLLLETLNTLGYDTALTFDTSDPVCYKRYINISWEKTSK